MNLQTGLSRRDFLDAIGVAVAGATLSPAGWVQAGTEALQITDVNGLTHIAGAGANVTALTDREGTLLVDGGLAEHAADLASTVAGLRAAAPVSILFNTNWRAEHTGANRRMRGAGADVFAHENTKLWLAGDFFVEWEHAHYEPQPPEALPNRTFYTSGKIDFGGTPVEYGYLPRAHTDGDVYVFFPNHNVLAVGDLLAVDSYPILDYSTGGWIGGFRDATAALLELADAQTRIVPAVGAVQTRAALRAQLEMCTAVLERVAEAYRQGKSFQEFIAAKPAAEFDARFGDSERFLALVYRGAWGHVRRLGGII
jgi:glyoxylase-like metal-dependent hydrolase (beta-lactamase superfamily II)